LVRDLKAEEPRSPRIALERMKICPAPMSGLRDPSNQICTERIAARGALFCYQGNQGIGILTRMDVAWIFIRFKSWPVK
jgi:hypothetical protein